MSDWYSEMIDKAHQNKPEARIADLETSLASLRQEVGRLEHDIERHVQIASNEANARIEAEAPILCDQTYNMAPRDAAKYFEECRDGWITKCDELSAALAAAEADKLDAQRYRWLRAEARVGTGEPFIARSTLGGWSGWTGEHADAAIDTAAAKQGEA